MDCRPIPIPVIRHRGGKIAEFWHVDDFFGLLVQLGVIPAPGQAPPQPTPRALPNTGDGSCEGEGDCE